MARSTFVYVNYNWQNQFKPDLKAEGESLCTMELEPSGTAVKLSVTHTLRQQWRLA